MFFFFLLFFVVCGFFLLTLSKHLSGIPSECHTVWIQIRPDVLWGLIRVQTVCKGYQQMTKVTSGGRVTGKQFLPLIVDLFYKGAGGAKEC